MSETLATSWKDCGSTENLYNDSLEFWDENEASLSDRAAIDSHSQRQRALKLVANVIFTQREVVRKIVDMAKRRLVDERAIDFIMEA